jgi:hypothetical protein
LLGVCGIIRRPFGRELFWLEECGKERRMSMPSGLNPKGRAARWSVGLSVIAIATVLLCLLVVLDGFRLTAKKNETRLLRAVGDKSAFDGLLAALPLAEEDLRRFLGPHIASGFAAKCSRVNAVKGADGRVVGVELFYGGVENRYGIFVGDYSGYEDRSDIRWHWRPGVAFISERE